MHLQRLLRNVRNIMQAGDVRFDFERIYYEFPFLMAEHNNHISICQTGNIYNKIAWYRKSRFDHFSFTPDSGSSDACETEDLGVIDIKQE